MGMKTKKKSSRSSLPKTALPRIYRIDDKIASGSFPNSGDLAKLCGTSIATISRDIEFMRSQLLAPIEYDANSRGYYYEQKTYRLPAGFTSAEDLLALGMAKSILSLYRETPLYDASRQLLDSIITPLTSDGNKKWLENRILVPQVAMAKINRNLWEIIIAALKENRAITFEYLGTWDDEYQKRKVRPYQILFDSGVWYLYGFAEERMANRIFSLSRMKKAALTRDRFSLPKNFSYADSVGDSYFGVFIGQEKQHFSIECIDEAAIFASERQWAGDQKITTIDRGVEIEFTSTQYDKVLKWVLSCGCNAIPRKPQILVDDWKWHISEMRKQAEK